VETPDELVHVDDAGAVRTVTLDSQHNRNALSQQLVTELLAAIEGADADDAVRVVVLQAAGPAFCAGADLKEMTSGGDEGRARGARDILAVLRAIASSSCPVVGRVHGPVRAGGIGIVAACDIAVATGEATFSLSEVRLALAPAIVSLTVGHRMHDRAKSLTWLTGETFDGHRAAELGLVTEGCAADELDDRVDAIVEQLAASPAQGLAATKRLLAAPMVADIDERGEEMAALSARLFGSEEAQATMRAFLGRRR
jgi:enoyl-CoA hydratase/carnithine racemase